MLRSHTENNLPDPFTPQTMSYDSGYKRPPLLTWSAETWKRWSQMRRMCTQVVPNTKFLLLKAPASTLYEEKFGGDAFMFTVSMFVERMISKNQLIGLALDCTALDPKAFDPDATEPDIRYFCNDSEWDEFDIDYARIKPTTGPTDTNQLSVGIPDDKALLQFIHKCVTLWNSRPNAHIAVFDSRGGIGAAAYLVVCFMVQKMKITLPEALQAIKESMDPGIFDEGMLRHLQDKFCGQTEIMVPNPPSWHLVWDEYEEENEADGEQETQEKQIVIIPPSKKRPIIGSTPDLLKRQRINEPNPINGLEPCPPGSPKYERAVTVLQQLVELQSAIFPGHQETLMTAEHLHSELTKNYNVSWHPVGRRGLLLILTDGVFFLEPLSDNSLKVSKANGMWFPKPKEPSHSQHRTLLDGVLVLDKEPGGPPAGTPRYLAMDIIAHEGGIVKSKPLPLRFKYLLDGVYGARKRCTDYNFNKECFRFRVKDVFELRKTSFLLSTFLKQVTHPTDGLAFIPNNCEYSITTEKGDPSTAGNRVLIWKHDGNVSPKDLEIKVKALIA